MNALERHLNLVFVLINTRRPLTRDEVRSRVGGYDPLATDEAFQRMFERDKEQLKKLGVPIETVNVEQGFSDQQGYIIDPEKFFLPDLNLDTQDRVILGEAAKVWTDSQLAELAEDAAERIGDGESADDDTAGSEDDGDINLGAGLGLTFGLTLNHEAAATLFGAIDDGRIVGFDYLTKGETYPKARTVEPWHILLSGGHWYLVGYDHARQEQRTFKLARFKSAVMVKKEPISHFKPDSFDILKVVSYWRQTQDGDGLATLHVLAKQAGTLRLQAESIESAGEHDVLTIRYANEEIMGRDIAAVADTVIAVHPESLRETVARILGETKSRHES